ncbi:unnamed protein product, partial [Aphanomyces euteiches]
GFSLACSPTSGATNRDVGLMEEYTMSGPTPMMTSDDVDSMDNQASTAGYVFMGTPVRTKSRAEPEDRYGEIPPEQPSTSTHVDPPPNAPPRRRSASDRRRSSSVARSQSSTGTDGGLHALTLMMAELVQQNREIMSRFKNKDPPVEQKMDQHEEWNKNVAPVGTFSANNFSTIVQTVEAPMRFNGIVEGPDAAMDFLRRFEEDATSCRWTTDEAIRRFLLYVGRPVAVWFSQLKPEQKSTWDALRYNFCRDFVKTTVRSKKEAYYNMKQHEGEPIREYLHRFNAAAVKINLRYDADRQSLASHVRLFAHSLLDSEFGRTLSMLPVRSTEDLREYLDAYQHNQTMQEERSRHLPVAVAPKQDRSKGRVNHYDAAPFVDADRAVAVDAIRAEIYALGQNGHEARRELCLECGKSHYKLNGECWANMYCVPTVCGAAPEERPMPHQREDLRAEGVFTRTGCTWYA